jgi:type I restriction enzyme M protein
MQIGKLERDYDLMARNPNRDEMKAYRHPSEITASLLEVERQILSAIEEVHERVRDGNEATI